MQNQSKSEEQYGVQNISQLINKSSEDQLEPIRAFPWLNESEQSEQDRQVFRYLMSVREQQQTIKKQQKIELKHYHTNQIEEKICSHGEIVEYPLWFNKWIDQIYNNWKIVIVNMQYILRMKKQQICIRKSKQYVRKLSLSQVPKMLQIVQKFTVSLAENTLIRLSKAYYKALSNTSGNESLSHNYHLWVYSLLAFHQSIAQYTNFQALASINQSISAQKYYQRIKIPSSINLVILVRHFHQKNLQKLLNYRLE